MKATLLCTLLASLLVAGLCCETDADNKKYDSVTKQIKNGSFNITAKENKVILDIRKKNGIKTKAYLYTKVTNSTATPKIEQDCEVLTTCIKLNNKIHAKIKADPEKEVIHVSRVIDDENGEVDDCFHLDEDTQWFAGPQRRYQHWPIQHMYYEEEVYLTTHPQNMALAERYWLSSQGIYVFADEKDPLFLDQNNILENHLCLVAKNKEPYQKRKQITLNYEIGVFADPKAAHENVIREHFDKPTGRPDERMVEHPIWSTWARYKVSIDEKVVNTFADEIIKNGFNNSQLEIDDNWETCYGSANFDPKKFPNVARLTSDLKKKGFRITLWIHPFINEKCNDGEAYDYALKNGYFVKNETGHVHTSWWQGTDAAAIDFTNPKAVAWWVSRLKKLEKLGIDGFKFDAGEESWLPGPRPKLTGPADLLPGIYTLNYTSALSKHFNNLTEARVGWRSQGLPIFVRMIDKDSRWTWNNGLPTLITTLLQMNLNGYVFVLPDMVAGNGYINNVVNSTELPSKELFIRWLQANTFMPSIQYSFVPWDYDAETIKISKVFTDLHAKYAKDINQLMQRAIGTGAPVNAPIWWVDPSNTKAHKVNDEYLLGEKILVAPVVEEGARSRDVYLPAGTWVDANTKKQYKGPVNIPDYPAPLNVLPYFLKIK